MTAQKIIEAMQTQRGEAMIHSVADSPHPHARIKSNCLVEICHYLNTEPTLCFNLLSCITAVDWPGKSGIELSYDLISIQFGHAFAIKVMLDRSHPEIESVSSIWPAAAWHEREAFDLMGVIFRNHPDLRRILMPDDWQGHPLRKDYQDLSEYHGLKLTPVKRAGFPDGDDP